MVFESVDFEEWLGHEDGALMNGISALIIEATESSLTMSTTCLSIGKIVDHLQN